MVPEYSRALCNQTVPGKLKFGTDCWTAPNHRAWMAIVVHWLEGYERKRTILDLVELPVAHTGEALGGAFSNSLDDFQIATKVSHHAIFIRHRVLTTHKQFLAVTLDNASNNDAMVDDLAERIESFPGAAHQCRCFTHILNLGAKAILRQFDAPKSKQGAALSDAEQALVDLMKDVDTEEDWSSGLEDDNAEDNLDGFMDLRTELSKEELAELEQALLPVKQVLAKVRQQ